MSYTDEELRAAVLRGQSYHQVLVTLKEHRGSQSYTKIKDRVASLGLCTSHFSWKRDKVYYKIPIEEILVEGSTYYNIKGRLIEEGVLPYRCSGDDCDLSEWLGKPLTLQLDHINGDSYDNRLENLRLLCPNCHSQTPTFCRSNHNRKILRSCSDCDQPISKGSHRCNGCESTHRRRLSSWPSVEELKLRIEGSNLSAVARELGVSGSAVIKHLDRRGYKVKNKKVFEKGAV